MSALDHGRDDVAREVVGEVAPVGRVEQDEVGREARREPARARSPAPSTWAALTVTAASASAGERCSCVQASEQTSGRLVVNELPGLKSVASAIAAPASTSARAGGIGRSRKSALAGSSTPVTSLAASAATPAGPVASRWSTERAPSSIASGIAPLSVNWSPCSRSASPASRHACEIAPRLRRVEGAALEEDVGGVGELRGRRQHLREREVEVLVRVGVLGRHRVRAEPGRGAAGAPNGAQRGELGVAVEPVARLSLPGRRPVHEHPASVQPDAIEERRPRRARASRGRSRGCRRPPRAAPRTSRRRAQRELLDAVAAERGMRVTVDEAGHRAEPAAVELLDLVRERQAGRASARPTRCGRRGRADRRPRSRRRRRARAHAAAGRPCTGVASCASPRIRRSATASQRTAPGWAMPCSRAAATASG